MNSTPIPSINLAAGQKLTILYISSGMANTCRREITITSVLPVPEFRPHYRDATFGKWRVASFKEPRGRKEFFLDVDDATLLLPGWNVCKVDSEVSREGGCSGFCGNACLTIAGTVAQVRELVAGNLNTDFTHFDSVLALEPLPSGLFSAMSGPFPDGVPAFPEVSTSHAVVQRIRENLAA